MSKEKVKTISNKTPAEICIAADRSDCIEIASSEAFDIPELVASLRSNASHGPLSEALSLLFVDHLNGHDRLMMSAASARSVEHSAVYWFVVGWSEASDAIARKLKNLPNPYAKAA